MADESTTTTPAEGTAPAGAQEDKKQEDKTFTQAELDRIITERLARAAKEAPSKEEMEAYKAWKEERQSESEKVTGAISKANRERDEALASAETLERKFLAVAAGIPADKAAKYVSLAATYHTEGADFSKAIVAALKDFPVPEERRGVPGAGGNPPPAGSATGTGRPKGTVMF